MTLLWLRLAVLLYGVAALAVLPAAILMGFFSELLKYTYILLLPRLNFQEVYGPFAISVSLMFWAFLSGLLMLTGAHLSAQKMFLKEGGTNDVDGLGSFEEPLDPKGLSQVNIQ